MEWPVNIGKAKNIPFSVIKNVSFFRATKVQTHRILIACFVIVHCILPWEEKCGGNFKYTEKGRERLYRMFTA